MENAMHSKNKVELTLLGIDKKWVRGPKGQWRDKSKALLKKSQTETFEMVEESGKKWWQFWK
jgi:hypothetical protein